MAPIPALMMIATAVGAGVQAYGQYQAGQAQARQYGFQADVNQKLAQIAATNANYDIAAGGVKQVQAGLAGRAQAGRFAVSSGARNIAGGSTGAVTSSIHSLSMENQKIIAADAAHAAYGESVQAAEKTATAGAMTTAAGTAVTAGDIVGSIVSGVGSVAGKWYDISSVSPTGGGVNTNVNPDSILGREVYSSSIYS